MENQKHIIHQQIVNADFYDRSAAQDVFKQISLLFKTRLNSITNSLLDNSANTDTFIKINNLELDAGEITYPINHAEFAMRYEEALKKALADYVKKNTAGSRNQAGEENKITFTASYAELLRFFLINGVLPWWASGNTLTKPDKTFFKLLQNDAARLKELLLDIGRNASVRRRLVMQFDETVIKGVLQCIEPSQADFIVQYHQDMIAIQKEKQLVPTEEKNLKESLWYFILTYLLVDQGGHFERKTFIKSTLVQMASHFNISYHTLLFLLTDTFDANPGLLLLDYSFPLLIRELRQEAEIDFDSGYPEKAVALSEATISHTHFEVLSYYLHFGSLPTGYHSYVPENISLLLSQQVKKHPQQLIALFQKRSEKQYVKRLTAVATEATLLEIIQIAEPSNANFIINYYQSTIAIQNKKSLIKTDGSEFKKSLLEFILTYLFTDHHSVFSAKRFVESNVKGLAQHFNIDYKTLLALLTQVIGEDYNTINNQSSLFFIFTEVLNEETAGDKKIVSNPVKINTLLSKEEKTDTESINDSIFIKDILLFWLLKGNYPWWAKEFRFIPVVQLFETLVQTESDMALLLLRQAMQQGIRDPGLLTIVSKPIVRLLRSLPNSKIPLGLLQELEELPPTPIQTENLTGYLLKALLESYYLRQFEVFDVELFFSLLLENLARATGISKRALAIDFNNILSKSNNPVLMGIKVKNAEQPNMYINCLPEINDRNEKDHEINKYLDEFGFLTGSNSIIDLSLTDLISKSYDILSYYLRHNRLPDFIKITDDFTTQLLIERLIVIVFEQDRNMLHGLLKLDTVSIVAKMSFHKSFSKSKNQQAGNILNLLKEYEEEDILLYMKQILKHEHTLSTLNELIHFMKQQNDVAGHKELLQLDTVVSHYAGTYKGIEFTNMITALTNKAFSDAIASYNYILGLAVKDSFEREKLLLYFREFCFSWAAETNLENQVLFFSRFLVFLNQKKNWDLNRLQEQISKIKITVKDLNDNKWQTISSTMEKETGIFNDKQSYTQQTITDAMDLLPDYTELFVEKDTREPEEPAISEASRLKEGEKIYIANAGLVLLHPFLSTLFQRIGLIENGAFINDAAKLRGPHVLQYMVDFSEENKEHDLLLNKLLCGITPDEVIARAVSLTKLEMDTANELLFAVTQQWEKLKNTSINGLQVSFLQREGSLSLSDEGWTLLVENKAYDILLQTLPWGLSFIKNSWMEQPIFVEWN